MLSLILRWPLRPVGLLFFFIYYFVLFQEFTDYQNMLASVQTVYLRSGCVYIWYTYDPGVFMIYLRSRCVYIWYTYDGGVFDKLTMRVCLWYIYDPVCLYLIYLRSGCAYDVLLMYLWCTYDVYLRCFANSLYSAQYTITTLSPSLYVFFTYPAIRNKVYILITWYTIRFLVEVNVAYQ